MQCPALCLSCSHHPPVTSETSALPAQRTASHSTLLQLEKHSFKKTRVAAVCETGSLGTIADVHTAVENMKWTTPKVFPEPCCESNKSLEVQCLTCPAGGGSARAAEVLSPVVTSRMEPGLRDPCWLMGPTCAPHARLFLEVNLHIFIPLCISTKEGSIFRTVTQVQGSTCVM